MSFIPLYITVFLATAVSTAIIEKMLIPYLKERAKQPIYEGGPSWHMSKSGTPTMGGIAFVITSVVSLLPVIILLFSIKESTDAVSLLMILLFSVANSLVGIIDDLKKLSRQENAGLTPTQKLIFQSVFAALFLYFRASVFNDETSISFSFGSVDLGILYYPLAFLLLVGVVNCANLTDGVDGLASSVALSIALVLLAVSAPHFIGVSLISSALIGLCIAFLLFNIHPAKIFMGDTGSLFLGAMIASCAFSLNNPFALIGIGAIYVIEGASVILQVVCFKMTGKRLFKMAPVHHHLEKCGFSENKICAISIIVTLLCSIITYIICFSR